MKWLVALLLMTSPAFAHEWYSKRNDPVTKSRCCGGTDCAKLLIEPGVLESVPTGYRVRLTEDQARKLNPVREGAIDVIVEWERVQDSEDGNFHMCIPNYEQPHMRADFYCFFAPPNS